MRLKAVLDPAGGGCVVYLVHPWADQWRSSTQVREVLDEYDWVEDETGYWVRTSTIVGFQLEGS